MTVNVSTTAANTANSNMYATSFYPQMANDYLGSQIFGSNPFGYQTNQTVFTTAPNDLASALVQQHAQSTGATPPTMQDYAYATQVANMFANQAPLLNTYTSFSQNDIFAQQTLPLMFNNGQTWA